MILDRHIAPVEAAVAQALGAVPVNARVKYGGAGRDLRGESRWYGRARRAHGVDAHLTQPRPPDARRIILSDAATLTQFQPLPPPLFGAIPTATVAVSLGTIDRARVDRSVPALIDRMLGRSRAMAALIERNDNPAFLDRVYLVVTHASRAATYEAVVGWAERGVEAGEGSGN